MTKKTKTFFEDVPMFEIIDEEGNIKPLSVNSLEIEED